MFWKLYRLRKSWLFQKVIKAGARLVRSSFVVYVSKTSSFFKKNVFSNNCLFGISISKKVLKKAVERNKKKREIRRMLLEHLKEFKKNCGFGKTHAHYAIVIIVRSNYLKEEFFTNKKILEKILFFIYNKQENKFAVNF